MSAEMDRLRASVARVTTAASAAETLIGGLAGRIRELQGDQAGLLALADELDARATELGAAVAENTPAG